jgi:chemotaxis protein MotB
MTAKPTVIIIKKKSGHGGHHGGAWKVAYADFVTAMMALFIVLWLLSSSKPVQEAVGGYFRDPTGNSNKLGSDMQGTGESFSVSKDNMTQLKEELQKTMRRVPDFDKMKNHIDMTITSEGLRIELMESATSTFFDNGSPAPNADGKEILIALSKELGMLPNNIAVEGHTDSKPYSGKNNYSNWELSVDRANAARRLMQQNGIRADQIMQVRGFADQRLRKVDDPLDPSNRRVSLIVQYQNRRKEDDYAPAVENKEGAKPAEGVGAKPAAAAAPGEGANAEGPKVTGAETTKPSGKEK